MSERIDVEIAPSILSADFSALGEEIKKVETVAKSIHIDVMDGHYVPNITIGVPVIRSLRKVTDIMFDVHLMIDNPTGYIDAFADAGSDVITLHIETLAKPMEAIEQVRIKGKSVGLSIHPDTAVDVLWPYLKYVDRVLVMSVYPGFGGQEFMEEAIPRISEIKRRADQDNPSMKISVDGGVNESNARRIIKAGANVLVVGSSVFDRPDPRVAVEEILKCAMSC